MWKVTRILTKTYSFNIIIEMSWNVVIKKYASQCSHPSRYSKEGVDVNDW